VGTLLDGGICERRRASDFRQSDTYALDGVYRISSEGARVFQEVPAPSIEALQALLAQIIARILKDPPGNAHARANELR
jgi:hypothetical protein